MAPWAASMKPYRGYMLVGALALLALGFWMVYRPQQKCEPGQRSSPGGARRLVRPILWIAAVLWLIALAVNLLYPGS